MPPRFQGVLFDFDDTLLNSFSARLRALRDVFANAGVSGVSAERFLRGLGGIQLAQALDQLEVREGIQGTDLITQYRRAYWLKEPGVVYLYPGVEATLRGLHVEGVKLGIVTQKWREFQSDGHRAGAAQELEEVGLSALFSVMVGLEDVANPKPHPEGVLLAMDRLGASPVYTLMVGDSPADIEAGRAAGCWSCLATWGDLAPPGSISDTGADFTAHAPEEVRRLVTSKQA